MAKRQLDIFKVTEINNLIKITLENNLPPRLVIDGEISNWRPHASGHRYFILKDQNSQIPAVMWRSSIAKLRFEPENGMAVFATGYVDVYPPHGKYQFIVESLKPSGVGDLQLAFEQMVGKLKKQGLFDEKYKKPIPAFPMRIGIVTSESGAAVHDIQDSIHNRWPCAKLFLYPATVQGKGAERDIASAIRNINARNNDLKLDILIVGRGGGSLEDLWCFNEEILARAIFDSQIPIISAVGHEIDTTIADLVADARASTPTKAGVIAVPDANEILASLNTTAVRLKQTLQSNLRLAAQQLATINASSAFRNPKYLAQYKAQQLDDIQNEMIREMSQKITVLKNVIEQLTRKIQQIEPHRLIAKRQLALTKLSSDLKRQLTEKMHKESLKLSTAQAKLSVLDPRSVLKRGYTITKCKKTGSVITDSAQISPGDEIITELNSGNPIESTVKNIQNTQKI